MKRVGPCLQFMRLWERKGGERVGERKGGEKGIEVTMDKRL